MNPLPEPVLRGLARDLLPAQADALLLSNEEDPQAKADWEKVIDMQRKLGKR